ncbi:SpoIIE family protein phosphatase [Flammeovirga sp. SubArs3]|uniref:SpoIIE family protein phosphatase n=1 Tax=Flammeovirga sp. SubArs3 TaxID=2995316 RepID=UPI00248CCBEE|nr:SpoIIE family protein phosphatase [Flammeovirga sp. SubArs3]
MDKEITIEVGAYSLPIVGEKANGDCVFHHTTPDFTFLCVIDGIGHGYRASVISKKLCEYIKTHIQRDIQSLIANAHEYMLGEEGAVIGIGIIENQELTYGSLGNISCRVINEEGNATLLTTDGLLGVRKRTIKIDKKTLSKGDLILIHSDGVNGSLSYQENINYHLFSSEILSKKIIKQWGSLYDDASVICVKVK